MYDKNNGLDETRLEDMKRIPALHKALVNVFGDKYKYDLAAVHGGAAACDFSHPSFQVINTIRICDKRGFDMIEINPYSMGIYGDIKVSTKDLNAIRRLCVAVGIHEFYWTVV